MPGVAVNRPNTHKSKPFSLWGGLGGGAMPGTATNAVDRNPTSTLPATGRKLFALGDTR